MIAPSIVPAEAVEMRIVVGHLLAVEDRMCNRLEGAALQIVGVVDTW